MRKLLRSFLLATALLCASATDDARIAAKLGAKMRVSKLKQDPLQFAVKDSVVEWTGSVKVPQRKGAATRMAKSAGAKRVVNRIRIAGGGAAPAAKAQAFTPPRTVTVHIPKDR